MGYNRIVRLKNVLLILNASVTSFTIEEIAKKFVRLYPPDDPSGYDEAVSVTTPEVENKIFVAHQAGLIRKERKQGSRKLSFSLTPAGKHFLSTTKP